MRESEIDWLRQQTTRWYIVTGTFFTCYVGTDDEMTITAVAPILRKFRGKKLFQLRRWRKVQSIVRLKEEEE